MLAAAEVQCRARTVFEKGTTLGQAIEKLLIAKRSANRREIYLKSLGGYLKRFSSGREAVAIRDLKTRDVECFLDTAKSDWGRHTILNRVSILFSFAVRRGWIDKNPCDRIDRVTIDRKPPQILSVDESRKLLSICPAQCKAWLILAMFAGIRPDGELMKVNWADVNLETATVRINFPKTRSHRRIVPLQPIAAELLRNCIGEGLIAPSHSTVRRFKREARRIMGWPQWPQDILRHTAASYLLALIGDVGKVAMMLGNSPNILLSHYHEPVTEIDCKNFWKYES